MAKRVAKRVGGGRMGRQSQAAPNIGIGNLFENWSWIEAGGGGGGGGGGGDGRRITGMEASGDG